ncbi:hypothetical protein CRUP_014603, partial [Coryphaenoides rupestris]
MLSEGFLNVLSYTDRTNVASTTTKVQGRAHLAQHGGPSRTDAGQCAHRSPPHTGPHMAELGLNESEAPSLAFPLRIPGSSLTCPSDYSCSLIHKYPDLRLFQEPDEATNTRVTVTYHSLSAPAPLRVPQSTPSSQGTEREPGTVVSDRMHPTEPETSNPDQGYLVMSGNPSLDPLRSRLAPMSNSLLNGLLEKKVEEFYRQYLTDSLARCNSQMEHSLLRGLVPPPQPDAQAQAPDSLEASLEGATSGDEGPVISYLNTYFSSPELRISKAD